MKKILALVTILSLFTISCSKDDDSTPASTTKFVRMTIDGVQKDFNTVVVNQEVFDAGTPDQYTELTVTATIGSSTNEMVVITLEKGDLGSDAIYNFVYKNGSSDYYENGLNSNVTTNSNNKIVGNFSGDVTNWSGTTVTKTISNGSFEVNY